MIAPFSFHFIPTDEERYIQEGLDISNSSKKKKRVFIHAESNFSDFKQTVVIWSVQMIENFIPIIVV